MPCPGAEGVDEDAVLPIAGVFVAQDMDGIALTTTLNVWDEHVLLDVTASPGAVVTGNGTDGDLIAGTAARSRGAGGPRLYRKPKTQRPRHPHGRETAT